MRSSRDVATFARSFALSPSRWAWLLGAGASAAANVPTGTHMIREFKARLFSDALQLPLREIDIGDPLWVRRIEEHFAIAGTLPPTGAPEEYAAAFEAAYPSEADRRTYIDRKVADARPSYGHRLLASLVATGQTSCVITTNFDSLVENAVAVARDLRPRGSTSLTVASIDSGERAARCVAESDWPLLVKLHGDFKESRLKNTTEELQRQDEVLRNAMVTCLGRFGLLVVGYSGRDRSVMEALHAALEHPGAFPAGIRWVARSGDGLLPAVGDLIDAAESAGVDAEVLEVATFDELAGALERQATLPAEIVDHLRSSHPRPRLVPVEFRRPVGKKFPALRCSALPIVQMPQTARLVLLDKPLNTQEARAVARERGVKLTVAARGTALNAFGSDADLLAAFGDLGADLHGDVPLDPMNDAMHRGLVYEALARALTRGRPLQPLLKRRGHVIRVRRPDGGRPRDLQREDDRVLAQLRNAYGGSLTGRVPNLGWPYAEAVHLRLDAFDDQWWCVLRPATYLDRPRTGSVDGAAHQRSREDADGGWTKERWARRYNKTWAAIIDAWAHLLVDGESQEIHAYPWANSDGAAGTFVVGRSTAWSRPASSAVPT